jgi:hypothetical protein
MAECLLKNRARDFWSEIRKIRHKNNNIPITVDGCDDQHSIANIFSTSYEQLHTSVISDDTEINKIRVHIDNELINHSVDQSFVVTADDVLSAVKGLKHGKNDGESLVTSDHFINAGADLHIHLALLISSMFSHGVAIDNMKLSTSKPIPKSKLNMCDSGNYRSIAISSVVGKIVYRILLSRLSDHLVTSDCQFGFKSGHSTTMCTFLLKETVAYYTRNDSSVYSVFLDATKAFDRINYAKLFNRLVAKKLPVVVIRFLLNLYSEQQCWVIAFL